MKSAMTGSPRPLLRAGLARTALPRIALAPSAIASIAMEDLRPKNMAWSGIGETSASRIIAEWAAWRRQACEQMLLDHDRHNRDSEVLALASLQAVSTMLEASFLRARPAAVDDDGSGRRALVRQTARERTAPAQWESSPLGGVGEEWLEPEKHVRRASQGDGDAHVEQRDPPRMHGGRARQNVVMRELQGLCERCAVSTFAHRSRLESILQGRLFCDGGPMHDDRSLSVATRELGQLSQSHHVTGLSSADSEHDSFADQVLCDDNLHLENATGNHEIHTLQSTEDIDQEHMHGHDQYSDSGSSEQGSEQSGSASSTPSDNSVRQEAGTYGQPNEGEDGALVDGDEERHSINSQEAAEPRQQPDQSFHRPTSNNWFGHPVDAVYGVDLPELLSRRSVSNLLSSGFGESLDQQLIQSSARRQELIQTYNQILNEDHAGHGINEPNQDGHDAAAFSGQGHRRRQWYWSRPEFVLDAIQDLEQDMAGLYLGMTSMQQMTRACMDMQIELQRSIKQEVSAALNRSIRVQWWAEGQRDDSSRWHLVRKGTCCICCDNQIDSLLYRCGHMCTCSKCANELLNGDDKCPMCRAPIVEVIRAYTA